MLKPKHLEFAIEYLKTGVGAAAYTTVYKQMDHQLAAVSANKLMNRKDVQDYIREQQEILSTKGLWSSEEIITDLKEIATTKTNNIPARIKAYHLGSVLLGLTKTNVNVTGKIENTYSNISDEDLDKMLDEEED